MELTDTERMLIDGLTARQREIDRLSVPIQQDWAAVARMIEQRLGLDEGAFGTTHGVQDGTVIEIPTQDSQQQDA